MRQSNLFFKTQQGFPRDEVATNAKLLIRAGFIEKLMAGVFSFLPLGERVRQKIVRIIREEMNALGSSEILMPALHPKSVWEVTGRWETLDPIMYKTESKHGGEMGLGPTHEEVISQLAKNIINSYQDLPLSAYQIQTKFRDEKRPKSGLLRGREFTMKDLYSFHADETSLNNFYEEVKNAYKKIFERCGLKSYVTEASGGDFSKEYSHEFMVQSDAGEDEVLLCGLCNFAQNKEIAKYKNGDSCPDCKSGVLDKINAIEVGNIFKLGTRFSEPVQLNYKDEKGSSRPVIMASYGIGVERLMGTVVEVHHDKAGMVWPLNIAPFRAHLITIGNDNKELKNFADQTYNKLVKEGVEVLYDDRKASPGEKLFDADLIGLPFRLVLSEKTLVQDKIEIKKRNEKEAHLVREKELSKTLL